MAQAEGWMERRRCNCESASMTQTEATKIALINQGYLCQYCLNVHHRVRHIFDDYIFGYHPAMAGGHHVFKRSRVDTPETIMALCAECHWKVENAKISKAVIVALMSQISGVDLYTKFSEYCKFSEAEWEAAKTLLKN